MFISCGRLKYLKDLRFAHHYNTHSPLCLNFLFFFELLEVGLVHKITHSKITEQAGTKAIIYTVWGIAPSHC